MGLGGKKKYPSEGREKRRTNLEPVRMKKKNGLGGREDRVIIKGA